jgi:hypothetical protein
MFLILAVVKEMELQNLQPANASEQGSHLLLNFQDQKIRAPLSRCREKWLWSNTWLMSK